MLLYLAIALVAAGVLVVLVSAAASGPKPASASSERSEPPIITGDPVFYDDEPLPDFGTVVDETPAAQADPEGVYTGSLYEDRNGVITPGEAKVGIMPGFIHKKGRIGVISRSGTLTYEAVDQLTKLGLGQSTCVGIGGDPVIGSTSLDILRLMMKDPDTDASVLIGEIGGAMEADVAYWVKDNGTKPVIGFIAGQTAPKGRRMGHAGAIIGGANDTAEAKMKIMAECGIHVVKSPADIGSTVAQVLLK